MTSTYTVRRSIVIAAEPALIAPEIFDLSRHVAWSPFARSDPRVRERIEGAPGVGQSRTFEGGRNGSGRLSVTAVRPDEVVMRLEMVKPFKSSSTLTFELVGHAQGTELTWSMSGAKTFVGRVMGLFFDADQMMGGLFEEGLGALKQLAEAKSDSRPNG